MDPRIKAVKNRVSKGKLYNLNVLLQGCDLNTSIIPESLINHSMINSREGDSEV